MKKILTLCTLAAFAFSCAASALGQPQQNSTAQASTQARPARQRIVGEVTGVDASAGRLSVRTDAGETVAVAVDDKTAYMRLPPGETTMEKAVGVTRDDVRVGDRVLVPDASPASGQATAARRVIVMGRAAVGAPGERIRDDGRRLSGRIATLDAAKKQIAVLTRGRDGLETVTLDAAAGNVRILRFAPDTLRVSEARPSTFAELKVGDQLRATGERKPDGARFTPEEVIAGSFTRIIGVVTATDTAHGEATIKNEQTGQTMTVAVGKNSMLKRLTPEFVETLEQRMQRAERREQRRASGGQPQSGENRGEGRAEPRGEREGRREGEGGRRGDGVRGGRNPQQMFESLPALALADLKKGDVVVVTASTGADDAHVTAISLVTGEADVMRRLQRGTDAAPRGMSPGLPGDVLGGGTGSDVRGREQQPPF